MVHAHHRILKKHETILCILMWKDLQDILRKKKSKLQNSMYHEIHLLNNTYLLL